MGAPGPACFRGPYSLVCLGAPVGLLPVPPTPRRPSGPPPAPPTFIKNPPPRPRTPALAAPGERGVSEAELSPRQGHVGRTPRSYPRGLSRKTALGLPRTPGVSPSPRHHTPPARSAVRLGDTDLLVQPLEGHVSRTRATSPSPHPASRAIRGAVSEKAQNSAPVQEGSAREGELQGSGVQSKGTVCPPPAPTLCTSALAQVTWSPSLLSAHLGPTQLAAGVPRASRVWVPELLLAPRAGGFRGQDLQEPGPGPLPGGFSCLRQ